MKISLLITTYNRGNLLAKSLQRLTLLTKPNEVLVIDDGGSDQTEDICKFYERSLSIKYVYHDNPGHTICSFARNVGVKLAKNDWIVTSEPELIFVTDIVAQYQTQLEEKQDHVISAGTVYHMQEKVIWKDGLVLYPLGTMNTYPGITWKQGHGPIPEDGFLKTVGWVAPYTACYKKTWIEDIGGWDEEFPANYAFDDTDLLTRLRIAGHNQYIDNTMKVIHQWHQRAPGDNQEALNEQHFLAKGFNEGKLDKLVANQGRQWGVLKSRPGGR